MILKYKELDDDNFYDGWRYVGNVLNVYIGKMHKEKFMLRDEELLKEKYINLTYITSDNIKNDRLICDECYLLNNDGNIIDKLN